MSEVLMHIVPFKSESGDNYLIGPFDHHPAHAEVMALFRQGCPDEASYVQEMLDLGHIETPFTSYRLPDTPGVLNLPMLSGQRCT